MVLYSTLHAAAVDAYIGTAILAAFCAVLRYSMSLVRRFTSFGEEIFHRYPLARPGADYAAMFAASFAVITLPLVILFGILTVEEGGRDFGDDIIVSKILLSTAALVFWLTYLATRWKLHRELWYDLRQGSSQVLVAIYAFICTSLAASMGGKLARGESLLNLLPFDVGVGFVLVLALTMLSTSVLPITYLIFTRPAAEDIDAALDEAYLNEELERGEVVEEVLLELDADRSEE